MRGGCELWLRVLASEPGLRKPVRNQEHWGRAGWGVPLADQTASGRDRGLWLKTLLWELLAPTKVGLQWALQCPWDWGLHQCPWAAHTDPQTRWLETTKSYAVTDLESQRGSGVGGSFSLLLASGSITPVSASFLCVPVSSSPLVGTPGTYTSSGLGPSRNPGGFHLEILN